MIQADMLLIFNIGIVPLNIGALHNNLARTFRIINFFALGFAYYTNFQSLKRNW